MASKAIAASLSVGLALLLYSSAIEAQYTTGVCSVENNRNVYKNDPQVQAGTKFPMTCTDPSKSCKCESQNWKVGPWYVNTTSAAMSRNYPTADQARASGTPKPYLLGVSSRAACCAACYQGNANKLDNGTFVGNYSTNQPRAGPNGLFNSATYTPNATQVFSCAYWQHFVPSPSKTSANASTCTSNFFLNPDACGYCIIYPPGTVPSCDSTSTTCNAFPDQGVWQAANYSTVGRGCPGAKNDPHFVGAKGTHFDFNGSPDESFCLVTEERFQINMKMRGYLDTRTVGASIMKDGKAVRTWIKDLGIVWLDESDAKHTLRLWARDGKSQTRDEGFLGGVEIDGTDLARLNPGETAVPEGLFTLIFEGFEKQGVGFFDVDVYTLTVPGVATIEIKLRIAHPLLQTPDDAMTHINVRFLNLEHTEKTHGVLGQTFRPGREKRSVEYSALSQLLRRDIPADSEVGAGFLDGTAADYKTTGVINTDCKYSAFGGKELAE